MFWRWKKKPVTPPQGGSSAGAQDSKQPPGGAPKRIAHPGTPTYPPIDHGIAVEPLARLMDSQADVLQRFRLISGMVPDEFERFYLRVLRNYAAYVHLLPVTRREHYRGVGGLLRWGFEASFFAFQAAEGRLFSSSEGIEMRRVLEPRWRYATFLSALCSELARPMTDYLVVDPAGNEWPAYEMGLMEWCAKNRTDTYMIRWASATGNAAARRGSPAYVLPKIIPADAMQYLQDGHPRIATAMLAVITNSLPPGEDLVMATVVKDVRDKLIARDRALAADLYGELTVGVHLEPHLVDGMRRLVRSGKWTINKEKPRLWYGTDGLFLVWGPTARDELLAELGNVAGIPRDETTLLETLVTAKVFMAPPAGQSSWIIVVPAGDTTKELKAVRIAAPESILPEESGIQPMPIGLLKVPVAASPPAAKAPSAQIVTLVPKAAPKGADEEEGDEESGEVAGGPTVDGDGVIHDAPQGGGEPSQEPAPSQEDPATAKKAAKTNDLLDTLPATVAETLRALIEDTQAGNPPSGTAITEKKGFAVTAEAISTYGVDPTEFGKALHTASWLELDNDKPERPAIMATIDGKTVRAFVIKPRKAKDLGLVKGSK